MKNRVIILLISLFSLIAIVSCGQAPSEKTETLGWQEQYDLGMRYLAEGNYSEAIIAFTVAIEIDPKQVEGYLGLSNAYSASGEIEKAIEVLRTGYEATGASSLQSMIDNLRSRNEIDAAPTGTDADATEDDAAEGRALELARLVLTDLSYGFQAEENEWNPGSLGYVVIQADIAGPDKASHALIAAWRPSWTEAEIQRQINDIVPIWKGEGGSFGEDGRFAQGFPVYSDDFGNDYEVLIVGLDSNIDAVAYALVPVHVSQ